MGLLAKLNLFLLAHLGESAKPKGYGVEQEGLLTRLDCGHRTNGVNFLDASPAGEFPVFKKVQASHLQIIGYLRLGEIQTCAESSLQLYCL